MSIDKNFLSQVAVRIAQPSADAPSGVADSILTVAAGSYGFRSAHEDELTMPTGFDPSAAALFESIVEAAYLVATADGVFDEAERKAFRDVVLEACRGAVGPDQLEALLADLADQVHEDGVDVRIQMVARGVTRPEHQREVLRIAALLAHVSGNVSEVERDVVVKLAAAFHIPNDVIEAVLNEARKVLADTNPSE
jgi:tellurite resistance protein